MEKYKSLKQIAKDYGGIKFVSEILDEKIEYHFEKSFTLCLHSMYFMYFPLYLFDNKIQRPVPHDRADLRILSLKSIYIFNLPQQNELPCLGEITSGKPVIIHAA